MNDNKKHYNFIEIGTSDFNTLIQECSNNDVGLSIDPLKTYLDRLPNKPNVVKINAAISNSDGFIDCFYVPLETIEKLNLEDWMRGCNSIGSYHKTVYNKLLERKLQPEKIIKSIKIPKLSIPTLIKKYNIGSCDYLKIDTEGHDIIILSSYIEALQRKLTLPPKVIEFESNELSKEGEVTDIINKFKSIGYILKSRNTDTILEYNK